MVVEEAKVVEHRRFQGEYRLLGMEAPEIAPHVEPGQFVHLRVPHMAESVLRRPFSVFKAEGRTLSILYKGVGRGTRTMTELKCGETVNLMGPLGRRFPPGTRGRHYVLVAGGYGMAALYLLARELPEPGDAFFGGRSKGDILCVPDFEALGWRVHVTTDDGSLGRRGVVTDALDAWLEARGAGREPECYACGPNQMLQAVGERAMTQGWTAWLSVDENMGCGVGACLTCVVKLRNGESDWRWARSCCEGPVFECRELLWESKD